MNKILIVDDNATNIKLIKRSLDKDLYQFLDASSGQEAIDIFIEMQPDLILLDIQMPLMDGYQVATIINSHMGNIYCPIIFVTAFSEEESLSKSLQSGGDDFITKPIKINVLESKVAAHLRIRELSQEVNNQKRELMVINQQLEHDQKLIKHYFDNTFKQNYIDDDLFRSNISPQSVFAGDLVLSEKVNEHCYYIMVADFTGHGLTASMGTLPLSILFRQFAQKGFDADKIAELINLEFSTLLPVGIFCAAAIIKYQVDEQMIQVWNGGLPNLYYLSKDGIIKETLKSTSLSLGIVPREQFIAQQKTIRFQPGDAIFAHTDGVIESINKHNDMFTEKRLEKELTTDVDNRFDHILNTLNNYIEHTAQTDDITMVEIYAERVG